MFEIVCVTDRASCQEDFLVRIRRIIAAKPDRIILRAKDMSETDYLLLSKMVTGYCGECGVKCTLHGFVGLSADSIHLPLAVFRDIPDEVRSIYTEIGVSVHSVEEAVYAEKSGASYVTAGHIFVTDCKRGLPPKGTEFLHEVCKSVDIPVYAIGGINAENVAEIRDSGAAGACIMSGFMRCGEPDKFLQKLRERVG